MRARFESRLREDHVSARSSDSAKKELFLSTLSSPISSSSSNPRVPAQPSPPVQRRLAGTAQSQRSPRHSQSPKASHRLLLPSAVASAPPAVAATPKQVQQQDEFKRLVRQFFNTTRQAFDTFDKKKHGTITRHDFMHAIDVVGMKISEKDRKVLRRMIDQRNTKTISYLDFEAFMNQEVVVPTDQESSKKDADVEMEQAHLEKAVGIENGDVATPLVAGCSLKQPVEAPRTQDKLDKETEELVNNFLVGLYSSMEQEEAERKQRADNSKDKASAQDWTVVRHKKKVEQNGNVWYDSESSEDSDCEDGQLNVGDLPECSFKRISITPKKAPDLARSPTPETDTTNGSAGSMFGF